MYLIAPDLGILNRLQIKNWNTNLNKIDNAQHEISAEFIPRMIYARRSAFAITEAIFKHNQDLSA